MRKILIIFVSFIILSSCGMFTVSKIKNLREGYSELGLICEKNRGNMLQVKAIPVFQKPTRVGFCVRSLNRKDSLLCDRILRDKFNSELFQDSLEASSTFLRVSLMDNISVIKELENGVNKRIFDYIKNNEYSRIVSGLRVLLTNDIFQFVIMADLCYLRTNEQKKQILSFYKDGELIGEIDTQEQIVFDYELSSFCWRGNRKDGVELGDIVKDGNDCHSRMKSKASELIKLPVLKY